MGAGDAARRIRAVLASSGARQPRPYAVEQTLPELVQSRGSGRPAGPLPGLRSSSAPRVIELDKRERRRYRRALQVDADDAAELQARSACQPHGLAPGRGGGAQNACDVKV